MALPMKYILLLLCLAGSAVCFAQKRDIILYRTNQAQSDPWVSEISDGFLWSLTKGSVRSKENYYKVVSNVPGEQAEKLAKKCQECFPGFFWERNKNGLSQVYVPLNTPADQNVWIEKSYLNTDEQGNARYYLQMKLRFGPVPASGRWKIEEIVVLCGNECVPLNKKELAAALKKDREERAKYPAPPPPPPPPPGN